MGRVVVSRETVPKFHPKAELKPSDFPDSKLKAYAETNNLYTLIDKDKPHVVPHRFPTPTVQIGPTCGLYALYLAVLTLHPLSSIPHPTEGPGSLLELAQTHGLTTIGAFYNICLLKQLCEHLTVPADIELSTMKKYLDNLKSALDAGRTCVVATEIDKNSFPSTMGGHRTHWVMLFGYFYSDDKLFFMVCHHNKIQLWSGHALFASNKHMPSLNPRVCKVILPSGQLEDRLILDNSLSPLLNPPALPSDYSLCRFSFTFLSVPSAQELALKESEQCVVDPPGM